MAKATVGRPIDGRVRDSAAIAMAAVNHSDVAISAAVADISVASAMEVVGLNIGRNYQAAGRVNQTNGNGLHDSSGVDDALTLPIQTYLELNVLGADSESRNLAHKKANVMPGVVRLTAARR